MATSFSLVVLLRSSRHSICLASAMSAVVDSVTVTTPELPSGVTFLHWETVAGRKYIKLAKADSKIVRLITNHGHGSERSLAHTSIIEELIKCRNERRSQLLEENQQKAAKAAGLPKEDLGIDTAPPAKKSKSKALAAALPEVIDVQTPAREGVDSIVMSVMLGSPTAPLWIELSDKNVDFIRKYAAAEIEAGDFKRSRVKDRDVKVSSPSPNVVWAYDRGSFRAKVKHEDGSVHFKDFKPESMSSEDLSLAGASAARFVASSRDDL